MFTLEFDGINHDRLKKLLTLLPRQTQGKCKLHAIQTGTLKEVTYDKKDDWSQFTTVAKGHDIRFKLKKEYRNFIFNDDIVEWDLKCAGLSHLYEIAKRYHIDCDCLELYVKNPERFHKQLHDKCGIDRDQAKQLYHISAYQGGWLTALKRIVGSLDRVEHTESYRVLKGLREECYTITVRLRSANEFKEMPNVYTLKAAKFLYNIITNRQNITVLKMIQWLDTHDLSPQLYVGDGVYAERRQGSLEALNEYLQLSCGESIQVVHKELNRTIDEAKILGHKERVGELYLDTLWGPPRAPGENLLAFRGQTQVKDLNFNDIKVR